MFRHINLWYEWVCDYVFFVLDLKEVKTFVDLLSISAGESDFEADRVSCLHTVCLEFEPIIFKLDINSGPFELIKCCREISEKVKNDGKLLDKLVRPWLISEEGNKIM